MTETSRFAYGAPLPSLAYCQTYRLGRGYEVEFSLDGPRLEARWSPDVPKGKAARKLLPAYRAARGQFLGSLGINVMVIEA